MSTPSAAVRRETRFLQETGILSRVARLAGWRWWPVGLAAVLALGVVLRLLWVSDMEYKREEAWAFERTQRAEPFPLVGMPNSVGVPHPGLSLWVFLG